jgi:glycerophosphoryl diester phosphodiesterase
MMHIAAHRGSSGSAPENTLAAFRRAAEDGADMIELDVRFSRDMCPVVIHDRTLRRTTNGRGRVHTAPWEYLRTLDAGGWFASRFAGEPIPLLSDVFDILPPEMPINVEVKTDGDRRPLRLLVDRLAELLRQCTRTRPVIVSSFDHRFLMQFGPLAGPVELGALLLPVRHAAQRPSTIARRLGATTVIYSRAQLRRRHVDDAHAHGIHVGVYTVNTPVQLRRVERYGVDLVFTNFPLRLRLHAGIP